jgi:predicted transcriptional regulator
MIRRPRADATDAELAVLKILWDRGPSTIRLLTDLLYPAGGAAQYATVQKLLERLEGKACVRRRSDGRVNVYSAAIELDDLIGHRLRETAEKLCQGSLTPLLTHLAGASELSSDDLESLRDLIRRLDDEAAEG